MKLCIISHCFYPSLKRGGPTVSVTNLAKALSASCEVSVITVGYDSGSTEVYSEIHLGKNRLFGCDVYYLKKNNIPSFYRTIQEVAPDTIYVSSLFSWEYSIAALLYARMAEKKVKLIIAPRGELMPSALSRFHTKKQIFLTVAKLFLGLNRCVFHATSQEEAAMIKKTFSGSDVFLASNISLFDRAENLYTEKQKGSLRILTVGRIHTIKNVDVALHVIGKLKGNIEFGIYGNAENKEYLDACMQMAANFPSNIQVKYHGNVDHESLKTIYPQYDVYLSPTQTENYGHSIVEALHSGLPVVISDRTPWHNLEEYHAGWDISLEQEDAFVSKLQSFVDMEKESFLTWKQGAIKYSEWIDQQMDLSSYHRMLGIE